MNPMQNAPKDIDDYIAGFPPKIQAMLTNLRQTIHAAAPEASEKISYQMPAFFLQGILVYFAAFKDHIGFFPTGAGVEAFKNELDGYKISKGTIQFPLDKPMPYDLITRIVQFRVKQNTEKPTTKKK
jgi:uncharacterized protein YdhG (YjbR/CyaY superfamily)